MEMVVLVVATTADPASFGRAAALLAWPDGNLALPWSRLVREDHLDQRWKEATGEFVDEVIFLSKHVAASKRPALTILPIGVPHLREDEELLAGRKPGLAPPPNPRIGPWLRLLKGIAESHNLTPEFEVSLEATHHGPIINSPTTFVEIGSTEEYWKRQDAANTIALVEYLFVSIDKHS